jgi:hypothetical protein
MSYEVIETSTEDGRPVELYEFQRAGVFFRFTSADITINDGSNDFAPIAIERSSIGQTDDFAKAGINIEFARDNSFASAFLNYSPDSATILTSKREHFGDDDFIVYWKGRVGAASATGSKVKLECESVFSSLQRPGLRARYQRMCRHVLYDENCTVDQTLFRVPSVVSAISGTDITFAQVDGAGNPQLDAYYSGENLTA